MTRAATVRSHRPQAGSLIGGLNRYFAGSESPLTVLVFLLPLLVAYELGTRYFASDWVRQAETRVLAFTIMRQFMALFGASGRYLPPMAVVGILLAWHIARRDPWELHLKTAIGMVVESAMLALPLLALGSVLHKYLALYAVETAGKSGFVLAIGAGIYEELVFRLMAFTILNILLIDVLKFSKWPAYVLIVAISSFMFGLYHYWGPMSSPFLISDFVFRTLAGAYFGWLFMIRGFGVTAGCHVSYDVYYFTLRAMAGA